MLHRSLSRLWLVLSISAAARAQLPQQEPQVAQPRVLTPASSVDPLGFEPAVRAPRTPSARTGDMGEPQRTPLGALSDDVPLPEDARIEPGASGDTLSAPRSGDPFFLGFVAERYYPPEGERIDPALLASIPAQFSDDRPEPRTYAYVMFERRITAERQAALEEAGARVLGFHPHYTLKVALEPQAIDSVAALDFVRWIGAPRSLQKLHPELVARASRARDGELLELYINVYESDLNESSTSRRIGTGGAGNAGGVVLPKGPDDVGVEVWQSNGWQQRALEGLGVEVLEYVDRIRAFRARAAPVALESLIALDFVQFVESDLRPKLFHDESTPLIQADYTRAFYDGGTNSAAVAGVIDSGTDFQHSMLNHTFLRWVDVTPEDEGTLDNCGHGSHVSGTVWGLPSSSQRGHTGVAPGLGWGSTGRVRSTKFFYGANCDAMAISLNSLFSSMRSTYTDSTGDVSPRPHVINNSWGYDLGASAPTGVEAEARAVDAEVWDYRQLYVFAAGNDGPSGGTVGLPGAAKNAFTVGSFGDFETSVGDPGALSSFSSRGPCGDNRWKPNLSAPGHWITSAEAETGSGLTEMRGTSMAAPHVAGVAAQLCDKYSSMRWAPHRLASVLMASAITADAAVLTGPTSSAAHLNSHGAGRVNAHKAVFDSTLDWEWFNWGMTSDATGFDWADFFVSSNVERVVVCMTYLEDECSAGASRALVNDFDLYLDDPTNGNSSVGNVGEWTAQHSAVNNTEIRILDNPLDGWWRWKVWPENVTNTARVSVTVGLIYGDVTPNGSLSVSADDVYVKPGEDVTITADVYNPEYYASSVFLDTSVSGAVLQSASTTLEDGAVTSLLDNEHNGFDLTVGALRAVNHKLANWVARWSSEGVKNWSVNARSDNWVDKTASVNVVVDGTPPGTAQFLGSSTHIVGAWSNNPNITYTWSAANDSLSGLDGYGVFTSTLSAPSPAYAKDIEQVTSYSEALLHGTWHFSLRAVDNSGNWSPNFVTTGPFRIDLIAPSAPTGLNSPTHTPSQQSCNTTVQVQWSPASDSTSGIAGYLGVWSTVATQEPTGATNIAASATSFTSNIGSSLSARYFHLRAKDLAGNWGPTQHFGPIVANAASVLTYCTGKTNSLGCVPAMSATGQPDISAGTFQVACHNVLNNKIGYLFWGFAAASQPFQGGLKCVASPTWRTPNQLSGGNPSGNDCSGSYSFVWTTAFMNSYGLVPGQTLHCQFWMRDPQSPSTSGLSNALRFTVCD